jgi:putative colanic acid biosynthesis UDP-glucose lipid carrier transferase
MVRLGFVLLDVLTLNLVFATGKLFYSNKIASSGEVQYVYLWMLFNLAWLLASAAVGAYQRDGLSSFETFGRRTVRAYIYFLAMVLLSAFLFKNGISRLFLISVLASIGIMLLVNRMIYLLMFQYLRNRNHLVRKVIIVGYNDISKKLTRQLEEDSINTEIVGYCENEAEIQELSHYPIIGDLANVIEISKQNNVTEIYSTLPPEQSESIYPLMQKADQALIRFRLVPNFNLFTRFPMHIDYYGNLPVLTLRKDPLDDVANRIRKRLFDLVVSSLVIVFILSWLIPLVSLLIWLESRGPIFFIQKRTGKNNRPFGCIKFRSMRMNQESHLRQATKGDARITRVGKFLRKTNLDEFPQFLNVFRSQMSIIGPRPHMLKHTDDYSSIINKYMVRQFMKPGITGWAQVNGYRGEIKTVQDIEKRVEYDLWYLENWNMWLDTRIIFLTVYNMVRGERNAY